MKTLVKSQDTGNEYQIDTEAVTCTCSNFKYRCHHYPIGDEHRLCKHLSRYFEQHPELMPMELIKADKEQDTKGMPDKDGKVRYLRSVFDPEVNNIRSYLSKFPEVNKFEICGSYRRLNETVSDLDVLITLKDGCDAEAIFNYVEESLGYERLWRGPIKAGYTVYGFIRIDFKIVPETSWAFSLLHFTGSKFENIRLRRAANAKGLSLSEYGLKDENGNQVESKFETEQDVYNYLGMPYKQPWERN